MNPPRAGARLLAGLAIALATPLAPAGEPAASNFSAVAPPPAKVAPAEFLRTDGAVATLVTLDAMDPALIDSAKQANAERFTKRLQVGLHRDVPATADSRSTGLAWTRVSGGVAARWEVVSPGARALRVGLLAAGRDAALQVRFSGTSGPVYGPYDAPALLAMSPLFWSPVVEGERAIVELFVADGSPASGVDVTLMQVSHLFVSPSDPRAEAFAKAGSQACEVDLICLSASDAALATIGKAVARMTFSDGTGSHLCTGTLLNPIDGSFAPYILSSNSCFSQQSVADTLTTHWFYDATACGSDVTSPSYVQVGGGATILYHEVTTDALFIRLKNPAPAGAVFAGWNTALLSPGDALVAVHHPAGDLKKVSLATLGGINTLGLGGGTVPFWVANWTSGVTEGGSGGSGIFTAVGTPPTDYQLRGALYGGPAACGATGTDLQDYYSRMDYIYAWLRPWLETYPLDVTVVGEGQVNSSAGETTLHCGTTAYPSVCSTRVIAGRLAMLVATPASGYVFSGWSGDACNGDPSSIVCNLTLSGAKSVTATFVPASVDVRITHSLSPNPAGTGKDAVFTMTAQNLGNFTALGVNVLASFDPAATVIWATPGCSALGAGVYQCPAGNLPQFVSRTFKLVLRKNEAGTIFNNVTVVSASPDTNTANNTSLINAAVNASPEGAQVQRYRLFSPVTKEHHFTTDLNEYNVLGTYVGTWNQEGPVGKVLNNPGSFNGVAATPYYRLYNTSNAQHHWTTDPNEYYTLQLFPQYSGEGVDGYIFPSQAVGTIPLYRLLYPFSVPVSGLHHWTIDAAEYNALITSFGWIGEGGSGFVIP